MWTQFIVQFLILLVIALISAVLLGRYIGTYFAPVHLRKSDSIGRVEKRFLHMLGVDERKQEQSWVGYAKSLLLVNLLFFIGGYLLLRFQGMLPFNPNGAANLDWSTAMHTTISFMTNTDQQHYSGEALSYLSQTFVLGTMLFVAPTMAFTVCMAVIRGLANKPLGNFYADFVRFIVRILLPISFVFGLLMILLGVPQTFGGAVTVTTLEGAKQLIYRGPVAAFEVIKQLGNNGGGFFGANGAHPFENPNGPVNFIQMFLMLLIPMSLPIAYGKIINSAKQGRLFLSVMTLLFIMMTFGMAGSLFANPTAHGQELRFGQIGSALYSSITTAAETGAVNSMHDSLHPLAGLIQLGNMMLNVVYGGTGAGFLNVLLYAFVAVFLTGLLIGRTPTFLGKKLETFEVKLIAITLLVPPFLILVGTAISMSVAPGLGAISNPGPHGLSQVLYEFTSATANNGSGFEGLGDATVYWNVSTSFALFFGRYIPLILMLAIAGSLKAKPSVPQDEFSFKTDTPLFGTVFLGTVVLVGALTFLPVLVLGPVADWLTM
ncbi:potassium-transporting ATPase subunit KdpA [Exiguobacterium antarcticum]|uniref:potassium-transporting ATPase subunit KdpA n=1 Tax=Exiguobacterium antarcticum TaxID=132920 RepID=UPI000285E9CB|nr:potassium-transporting ATPase subunit KdpA [Exiguobacterium antarcticum]AFS71488.1 Potassium-transporting ATPase A chain [Exiguobacterium antarcticum B7]